MMRVRLGIERASDNDEFELNNGPWADRSRYSSVKSGGMCVKLYINI